MKRQRKKYNTLYPFTIVKWIVSGGMIFDALRGSSIDHKKRSESVHPVVGTVSVTEISEEEEEEEEAEV